MAWHLVKSGRLGGEFGLARKTFLIDESSDIHSEPTEYGPIAMSSIAYTADKKYMFEKDGNGQWVQFSAKHSVNLG